MKTWFTLILLLAASYGAFTQNTLAKKWDARFGGIEHDFLYSMIQTSDNGFMLGGYSGSGISGDKTQNTQGGFDYWIVKVDSNGNKQWDKRFGGTGDDLMQNMYSTSDKGYILGGRSTSDISGNKTQPNRGGYDYWIVKIDSLGNKQWDKCFGGSGEEYMSVVRQTNDGGYLIGGSSNSSISGDKTQSNRGDYDYWIVKVDSQGNLLWEKTIGGTQFEDLEDAALTIDGGYLIGGTSRSHISGEKTCDNYGTGNFWIVKVDSSGNQLWDRVYGGYPGEEMSSILSTNAGGYILGGKSYSGIGHDISQGKMGYWLIKCDSSGNKIWDRAFGGYSEPDFTSLIATRENGYILTGYTTIDVNNDKTEHNLGSPQTWLVSIDSMGNKLWDKTIFSMTGNFGQATVQTNDGCYIIAMQTPDRVGGYKSQPNWDPNNYYFDYWIIKMCDSTITGITETVGDIHFSIYPNPTTREISITLQKDNIKEADFTLTNTAGQVIYQSDETNLACTYTKMLDLGHLPTGIYVLDISVDGQRITRKVLKE